MAFWEQNLLYTKYCFSKKVIISLKYFSDLTEPQIFKVDFVFFFMNEIKLKFYKNGITVQLFQNRTVENNLQGLKHFLYKEAE